MSTIRSGPSGPLVALGVVESVFGRAGAVVAVSGDYTSTLVTNSSGVAGATVTDALDTLAGASAPVTSVFGRIGVVVAVSGDYTSTLVTNSSGVTGATVTDALNTLDVAAPVTSVFGRTGVVIAVSGDYTSTLVTNSSGVTGATVTDALNTLDVAAPVTSVFGRTGVVIAVSGDYTSTLVTNSSGVTGATVTDALNTLDVAAPVTSVFGRTGVVIAVSGDYTSTLVTNSSGVTGTTVTDALNTLNAASAPAPGTISGLHISNDGVTPDEIVDIDTGTCRDSTNVATMVIGSTLSPDITASGADGLDTGAVAADTLYAVYAIVDTTAVNSPAGLFSLVGTAPTLLPAGYDVFRRVGWILTDATSDIVTFDQPKSESRNRWVYFRRSTQIEVAGTASAFTATTTPASDFIPNTATRQQIDVFSIKQGGSSSDSRVEIVPDGWDETAGAAFWQSSTIFSGANDPTIVNTVDMPVGPSQLIRYQVQAAGDAEADIFIRGYQDTL